MARLTRIKFIREHLSQLDELATHKFEHSREILTNIAHSLQYIEFLNNALGTATDASVIQKQLRKSIVVYGGAVIEALLFYRVQSMGMGKRSREREVQTLNSSSFQIEGKSYQQKTILYEILERPVNLEPKFIYLQKKVIQAGLFGKTQDWYDELDTVRLLRNRIHLQNISDPDQSIGSGGNSVTSYYLFDGRNYSLVLRVLYGILSSEVFEKSHKDALFDFLKHPILTKEEIKE